MTIKCIVCGTEFPEVEVKKSLALSESEDIFVSDFICDACLKLCYGE